MAGLPRFPATTKWVRRACVGLGLSLSLLGGCNSNTTPTQDDHHICKLSSDCSNGLICTYGYCHSACAASIDCPTPQRCVKTNESVDDSGTNMIDVCQLPAETHCNYDSQCQDPMICAIDRQCRNMCLAKKDCVGTQVCADGACAEPSEVDANGHLIGAINVPDASSTGTGGAAGVGGATNASGGHSALGTEVAVDAGTGGATGIISSAQGGQTNALSSSSIGGETASSGGASTTIGVALGGATGLPSGGAPSTLVTTAVGGSTSVIGTSIGGSSTTNSTTPCIPGKTRCAATGSTSTRMARRRPGC